MILLESLSDVIFLPLGLLSYGLADIIGLIIDHIRVMYVYAANDVIITVPTTIIVWVLTGPCA